MRMRFLLPPPLAAKEPIQQGRYLGPAQPLDADGKSLFLGCQDDTRTAFWIEPLDGVAREIVLGDADPSWWVCCSLHQNGAAPSGCIPFPRRIAYPLLFLTLSIGGKYTYRFEELPNIRQAA